MGFKNVKNHYRIGHIVHVTNKGICIGSTLISKLLVIGPNGSILLRYEGPNPDLRHLQENFDADPDTLRRLIETPDPIDSTVPAVAVYTYRDGEILEKFCNEPGWPNVTHDGELMYDNRFFIDKKKAVAWARKVAEGNVRATRQNLASVEAELRQVQNLLANDESDLARLDAEYPAQPSAEPQEESARDLAQPSE